MITNQVPRFRQVDDSTSVWIEEPVGDPERVYRIDARDGRYYVTSKPFHGQYDETELLSKASYETFERAVAYCVRCRDELVLKELSITGLHLLLRGASFAIVKDEVTLAEGEYLIDLIEIELLHRERG